MESTGSYVYSGYGKPNTGAGIILGESTAAKDYVDTLKLEAKAARSAANKGLKVADLNYPSGYLPEDDKVLNDLADKYITDKAIYLSGGTRNYGTEAQLQNLKKEIERNAELSKQFNADRQKAIDEVRADPYAYPADAIEKIEAEKAKPIDQRQKIQVNKLNEKHWADEIAKGATEYYYTKVKGYYGSKGGGSTTSEVKFDPARAEAAWQEVSDYDRDSRWFQVLYRASTDDARKEYEKTNPIGSFDTLPTDTKSSLINTKAKDRYLKILEERVPKDESTIAKANRASKGGGKNKKEKGTPDYFTTSIISPDGTLKVIENWVVPKPSATDAPISKSIYFDSNGQLLDKFTEATGVFRRVEGKNQVEFAVNIYDDLYGKGARETIWLPLTRANKAKLNSMGIQKLSEVTDEATRKSSVEGFTPMTPADFNNTLGEDGNPRTQQEKDNYLNNYNAWKNKGAKKASYTGRKDQLTEFKDNKKAGTFDPASGTINWA